jgi:opacity protein-like surface antigen
MMLIAGRVDPSDVDSTSRTPSRGAKAAAVAGIAVALSLLAASGAKAQNCTLPPGSSNFPSIASSPASISAVLGSTITTASTAFLLQSTAFIGSPANPEPGQQGGGVWARAVGGEIDVKSNTTTVGTAQPALVPGAVVPCTQKIHENFSGVQLGTDIARLNIGGWNLHWGTTAGYLEARGHVVDNAFSFFDQAANLGLGGTVGGGPFNSTVQVPFVGTYAAATYGGFFVDGLVRTEYYQTNLNAPLSNLFNQNIDARGVSFSGSIGYNWQIPNSNWFIEPSAGVIVSRIKVDPFNYVTSGTPGATSFSGTVQLDDIKSDVGRLGLRFGTTINVGNVTWQPFASVSVWHEFGPSVTSNYQTCGATTGGPGCAFALAGTVPVTLAASSNTSTFGTFGQYSLGFSATVPNTGWLSFARVDYRNGSNLEGLSGTGGIRYQFTPEAIASTRMFTKGPAAPIVQAVNWSGFYVGGFGGGVLGTADWNFVGGSTSPHVGGYIYGGNIGYNYQAGAWVFGVEADLGKTNLNGGTACTPLLAGLGTPQSPAAAPLFQMTCNAWANWIATATARIGYAWERTLWYVNGGGAWTDQQFSATCNLSPTLQASSFPVQSCSNPAGVPSLGFAGSKAVAGWTVGFGTEFALTQNWSAKASYNYISFGDRSVTASDGTLLNVGMNISEVKVGINYRFAGGWVY